MKNDVYVTEAVVPTASSPPQKSHKYVAIWDTGATGTVITSRVATECGLKPIGMVNVNTAGGERKSNVYLINLVLPSNVIVGDLRVTEGILAGDAEVLVGMDVIGTGDFLVSNYKGKTTFSFRIPSLAEFDFVNQKLPGSSNTKVAVGRNDPCPCHSGKKYKQCCMKKTS